MPRLQAQSVGCSPWGRNLLSAGVCRYRRRQFKDSRRSLKLVCLVFGEPIWAARFTWKPVIELVYGPDGGVGGAFDEAIRKIDRIRRFSMCRHALWLSLATPSYDIDPEARSARRRRAAGRGRSSPGIGSGRMPLLRMDSSSDVPRPI